MTNEPVPETDHIARHCRGTQIAEDGRPHSAAFICDDSDGISCNWVEYFEGNANTRFAQVRAAIAARRTVTGTHRIAILNVGAARASALNRIAQSIAIMKDPRPEENGKPADPSHALIEQAMEAARVALGEALADCVKLVISAKS
jgi:hypothetical protein